MPRFFCISKLSDVLYNNQPNKRSISLLWDYFFSVVVVRLKEVSHIGWPRWQYSHTSSFTADMDHSYFLLKDLLTLQMPFWRPLPFDIFSIAASFSPQQRPFSGSWLRCHCSSNSYFLTSRLNSGCFKAIKTYFNLFFSISDFFRLMRLHKTHIFKTRINQLSWSVPPWQNNDPKKISLPICSRYWVSLRAGIG